MPRRPPEPGGGATCLDGVRRMWQWLTHKVTWTEGLPSRPYGPDESFYDVEVTRIGWFIRAMWMVFAGTVAIVMGLLVPIYLLLYGLFGVHF